MGRNFAALYTFGFLIASDTPLVYQRVIPFYVLCHMEITVGSCFTFYCMDLCFGFI